MDRLPQGLPAEIGTALRLTLDGEAEAVHELLRDEGSSAEIELDPEAVLDYLLPIIEPAQVDEFTFTPRLDAVPGHADRRSPLSRVPAGPSAQPAPRPYLPHPPGDHEHP
ncbi:hypothetical protein GCM10020221_35230 [Streptomyces thioluteus]|uniref:Uncharacterized protein n=1 Tax=Streptomyces thioluteus TaxID=66431 RepID=A0ABN3X3G8_STRTU